MVRKVVVVEETDMQMCANTNTKITNPLRRILTSPKPNFHSSDTPIRFVSNPTTRLGTSRRRPQRRSAVAIFIRAAASHLG
jgi:hypothetical protein